MLALVAATGVARAAGGSTSGTNPEAASSLSASAGGPSSLSGSSGALARGDLKRDAEAGEDSTPQQSYAVEAGAGYVSNAGDQPSGKASSIQHFGGEYTRIGKIGDVEAGLALRGTFDFASQRPSGSEGAGLALVELRRSLSESVTLSGSFSYGILRRFDERYSEAKAVEGVTWAQSAAVSYFLTTQQRYLDYQNYRILGFTSNENDRDRLVASAEAGAQVKLGEEWGLRLSTLGEVARYGERVDDFGYRRNYAAATPLAGLVYARDPITWAIQVGYMVRTFEEPDFKTLARPVASFKVALQASEKVRVNAGVETVYDDPDFFESRAVQETRFTLGVGLALSEKDQVLLSGLYRIRKFTDLDRRDQQWLVAGEWQHALDKTWSLVGRVSYGKRDLPLFALDYDQVLFRLALRYQG